MEAFCSKCLKPLNNVLLYCRTDTCVTFDKSTGYVAAETDLFTVCLLATDKEDTSMYKLIRFNVSTCYETMITEIPHRKDCAIASFKGKLYYVKTIAFYKQVNVMSAF